MVLKTLETWWRIIAELEESMVHVSTLKDIYDFFYFTGQIWVYENLLRLAEVGFTYVPARVDASIRNRMRLIFLVR